MKSYKKEMIDISIIRYKNGNINVRATLKEARQKAEEFAKKDKFKVQK